MREIDWYFDPISPYAYLALAELHTLAPLARIRLRPVLFAGLLGQWDNVGPAEIPPKRVWTYRFCAWQAAQKGIPFVTLFSAAFGLEAGQIQCERLLARLLG